MKITYKNLVKLAAKGKTIWIDTGDGRTRQIIEFDADSFFFGSATSFLYSEAQGWKLVTK